MADDQNESGVTSQGPVDVGNDAVKSLAEAITLVLQQTGKQDSANAGTGAPHSPCIEMLNHHDHTRRTKVLRHGFRNFWNTLSWSTYQMIKRELMLSIFWMRKRTKLWNFYNYRRHCRLTNLSVN